MLRRIQLRFVGSGSMQTTFPFSPVILAARSAKSPLLPPTSTNVSPSFSSACTALVFSGSYSPKARANIMEDSLRWIVPPGAEKTKYLSGINQLMLSWCLIASRLAKHAGDLFTTIHAIGSFQQRGDA